MTTHTRFIIITTDTNEKIVFAYHTATAAPKTASDSYALHLALAAIDPGDEYTVKFTNQPLALWKAPPWQEHLVRAAAF